MPTDLKLDVRRVGEASVVSAFGQIDLATFGDAEAALAAARYKGRALILDLRGVEFMDTSGLRMVLEERRRANVDGYRFVVVRGPLKIQRLFEIAGLPHEDVLFVDAPDQVSGGGGA